MLYNQEEYISAEDVTNEQLIEIRDKRLLGVQINAV